MPHPIFSTSAEDIRLLDDAKSRELIARLCRAEVRNLGGSEGSVTWGGDQRAKDGGVDVRVDADITVGSSAYVPKLATAYQVKAESFAAGRIANEMAPGGVLRPAIQELATSKGAYVIVSTRDNLSDSSLASRKRAMSECLSNHGLSGKVVVDFFDSRRIADWVEQNPTVAVWLRSTLGSPLVGWRPYGPWAYREDTTDAEYIVDDRARILVPNADDPQDIISTIESLRASLKPQSSIRLVGLSGVGKTRLVQALFDPKINTTSPALHEGTVVYGDLSDSLTPQPTAMIEALLDSDTAATVVIDNCGSELHKRLTDLVKRSGSRLSLMTIEYDIRDDLPDGTLCYRLEAASVEVIKKLLVRRFPELSANDVQRVAEFSDGNARVAFALAGASDHRDDLAQLGDDDLFRRLFHQKHGESDELLKCAEAASLLYSFDGVDTSAKSELSTLAALADMSVVTFSRHITELRKRGLVQERGQWRAILPHAIANRLAGRALDGVPRSVLIRSLVDDASDRMAKSFTRRLGYLHRIRSAQQIVAELLKSGGPFSELAHLTELGRDMLRNVAPVAPEAVLRLLKLAIAEGSLSDADESDRSQFARMARSLAYDADMFDDALDVLLELARSKLDSRIGQSPREAITTLFYVHYSGTHATIDQRAARVDALLKSDEAVQMSLGLDSLKAALQTDHFSPHFEFEFGARPRDYGWRPRGNAELEAWFGRFIDIAIEYGLQDSPLGKGVREALGEALRGLWVHAEARAKLRSAAEQLNGSDGWIEGWVGVRLTLRWHRQKLSPDSLSELLEIERLLEPKDLANKIRARVLARDAADLMEQDGDDDTDLMRPYLRAQAEAEELGRLAGTDTEVWPKVVDDLLGTRGTGNQYAFGIGLGSTHPDVPSLLTVFKDALSTEGSKSTLVVRGILHSWSKRDEPECGKFLDQAVYDDTWGRWFPELQCAVGLEERGFERMLEALGADKAPIWQYTYLGMGRATDVLTVDQIGQIVDAVAKQEGGLSTALDILGMAVHLASEHGANYVGALAVMCGRFLAHANYSRLGANGDRDEYHIDTLVKFFLKHTDAPSEESKVLVQLLRWEKSKERVYAFRRGCFLKPFFELRPQMALNAIYKRDKHGRYTTAKILAANADSDRNDRPMSVVPASDLAKWCKVSPDDRCSFAASTCALFTSSQPAEDSDREERLSDAARAVLEIATDKKTVVDIFISRLPPMSWSGSRAAKLRRRLSILDQIPTPDAALGAHIAAEKQRLLKAVDAMELAEQEEERSGSSFE
jgi:hypothetical protein